MIGRWLAQKILNHHGGDMYVVRVKSWRPRLGPYGVEWPTVLAERPKFGRYSTAPCWPKGWHPFNDD